MAHRNWGANGNSGPDADNARCDCGALADGACVKCGRDSCAVDGKGCRHCSAFYCSSHAGAALVNGLCEDCDMAEQDREAELVALVESGLLGSFDDLRFQFPVGMLAGLGVR